MRIHPIESFVVETVKDEHLPENPGGFIDGAVTTRSILEKCPGMVVTAGSEEMLPLGNLPVYAEAVDSSLDLKQPSQDHRRSFEIQHPSKLPTFTDEYGHVYGSINLKGNNFSNPSLMETSTAPDGVIAYGLQESSVIRRVLRASRIMREAGISTEYIMGLAEPKAYPMHRVSSDIADVEMLPLAEYKRRLVEEHWRSYPESMRTPEQLVDLTHKIGKMTFYVTMRAMDTSLRASDILNYTSDMQPLYDRVKGGEKYTGSGPESRGRYYQEVLIPRVAENMARLHKTGLAHRFPNSMNITALGSIVDLDSVHGEPLGIGDEPITGADMLADLVYAGLFFADPASRSKFTDTISEASLGFDFAKSYYKAYCELTPDLTKNEHIAYLAKLADCAVELSKQDDPAVDLDHGHLDFAKNTLTAILRDEINFCLPIELLELLAKSSNQLLTNREATLEVLRTEADTYLDIIIDMSINELNDNHNFDVVGHAFADIRNDKHEVLGLMHHDITNLQHQLVSKAVQQAYEAWEPVGKELQDVISDAVKAELVSQEITHTNRLSSYFDTTAFDFIKSLYDEVEDLLRSKYQLYTLDRLFPEEDYTFTFRTGHSTLLTETGFISGTVLADKLSNAEHDINVDLLHPQLAHDGYRLDKYNYIVSDDHVATEVISDYVVDGSDCASDPTVKFINFYAPDCSYVLVVEKHFETGKPRLRLLLHDAALVERLEGADKQTILEVLRGLKHDDEIDDGQLELFEMPEPTVTREPVEIGHNKFLVDLNAL